MEGQKQAAKIVMYDSDEAAKKVTLTGWVSRKGHFYGDNEHLARWDGYTHKQCDCGKAHEKAWTVCERCRSRAEDARYEAMPFTEWDGTTPLTLFHDDQYFWHEDDVFDYCEMNGIKPEDLQLVICEPNFAWEIDPDYYSDILPEDQTLEDRDPELAEAIEKVNELIRKREKPISWGAGKFRTSLKSASTGQEPKAGAA